MDEAASVYPAPGGRVLVGPMLTLARFAIRIGRSAHWVADQSHLLRIAGPISAGPAYPSFLLDGSTLRLDLCFMGLLLRRRMTDLEGCDWLVRPNPDLGSASPLQWLDSGGGLDRLIDLLPDPTKPLPPGVPRAELDDMRRAWPHFLSDGTPPGWAIPWHRVVRRDGAYPVGI